MSFPQELMTAAFVFINLFSLAIYAILGERISNITANDTISLIFTTNIVNILYLCLIIFIGIRIFAFFIGRDLNDLFLHRSLNSGGTRMKLRVLAILIVCEMLFFGSYIWYLLYPFKVLTDRNYHPILFMICFSHILNVLNIFIIYFIHPDLWGTRFDKSVKEYCDRMERERIAILEL